MTDLRPIPQYRDSLGNFVADLRNEVFPSQVKAAKHVGLDRSRITRYEGGKYQPDVGYIAHLATLIAAKHESGEASQEVLLSEVNTTIRQCYQYERSFQDWAALVAAGDAFIEERRTGTVPASQSAPEPISYNSSKKFWGDSPEVSEFFGRESELEILQQWMVADQARMVGIIGIGGMGKTMVAKKAAQDVADHFEYVIWHSLRYPSPVEETMVDLIHFLHGENSVSTAQGLNQLLGQLMNFLTEHRCLLIIDNAETILAEGRYAGRYLPDYERYAVLFNAICNTAHQSCVMLTSREKSQELAHKSVRRNAKVHAIELAGVDVDVAQQVLDGTGLAGTEAEWTKLVQALSGNLWALENIAVSIGELYAGDIARFLEDHERPLMGDATVLLDEQWHRLTQLEKELLYWLVIEQEPCLVSRLESNAISALKSQEISQALESLRRRAFIRRTSVGFTLIEIVYGFLVEQFIDQICAEIINNELNLLNSHALKKATSKDYLRHYQEQAILRPIVERLRARFRTTLLVERRLGQLIVNLRQNPPALPGYAGGNLFNLLCHMQAELKKYDFSEQIIWQVDMVNGKFQDLNLTDAILHNALFIGEFESACCLGFSHDGERLATGTISCTIPIWRIHEQQQEMTLEGHTDWVRSVIFSPADDNLYSGSDDASIRIWDMLTGQSVRTLRGHQGRVLAVAINPAGNVLASGGEDEVVRLWNPHTGRLIRVLDQGHTSWVWGLDFSPDGRLLASSSGDFTIRLWDAVTGTCLKVLEGHTSWVWSVVFSPDGSTLASSSHDQSVRLWDVETGACLHVLDDHPGWIKTVRFTPTGDMVASGTNMKTLHLWDVASGEIVRVLRGHKGHLWALAFSPDGKTLVSSSDDRSIRLWDMTTFKPMRTLTGQSNAIRSIALTPDDRLLAAAGNDRIIHLWDTETGEYVTGLREHENLIRKIAVSPDGSKLVSCSADHTVRVWEIKSGECTYVLHGHTTWVDAVAIAPDNRLLASTSSDLTVRLWDCVTGASLGTLSGDHDELYTLAFSPDGQWLAAAGEDNLIWVWEVATNQVVRTLSGHTGTVWSVCFSSNGQRLVSGSGDRTIGVWNAHSGELHQRIDAHNDSIEPVAVNRQNTLMASGSNDNTIKLWDFATGQHLKTFEDHTNSVYSLAFRGKEGILISGGLDETIRYWDINTGDCVRILRADRPYERMNISGITGISPAQRKSLKALGALEDKV